MKEEIKIFYSENYSLDVAQDKSYELLDTGQGEKLERFGKYTFVRPHEDAVWQKCSTPGFQQLWDKADGRFWSSKTGTKPGWKMSRTVSDIGTKWGMEYRGIKFLALPTQFRHLGFFPEQASHWDFIEEKIKEAKKNTKEPIKFLNLFGYTGLASLFALRAGAEVTHVDASKKVLDWAKENQNLNQDLAGKPMRIIEDDVLKFLEREEKRGNKYDCIIMDPPKHGRGPKGELWKIEEMLPVLLSRVDKVLSEKAIFVILTSYSTQSSALSLGYALKDGIKKKGDIGIGELCVLQKSNNLPISFANTVRLIFND